MALRAQIFSKNIASKLFTRFCRVLKPFAVAIVVASGVPLGWFSVFLFSFSKDTLLERLTCWF